MRAALIASLDLGGVRRTSLQPAVRPKFGVSAPTAVVFGMKIGRWWWGRSVTNRGRPRGLAWCRELCFFFDFESSVYHLGSWFYQTLERQRMSLVFHAVARLGSTCAVRA